MTETQEPQVGQQTAEGGADDPGPSTLNILCVRNLVLFPGVVLPISVGRKRSIDAVQDAVRSQRPIGLLLQRDQEMETPGPDDLYRVGGVAEVLRYITAMDGSHHVICQGQQRFRVLEYVETEPFLIARVDRHDESETMTKEIEARFLSLKGQAREALQLLPQVPQDLEVIFQNVDSASTLADMIATYMDLSVGEKQEILETFDIRERLDKVSRLLGHRLEVLRLSREISQQTKGSMEKAQREYYLREQLKTIQKELGEEDAKTVEIQELTEAIAKAKMPADVEKEARRELGRLERMPEAAAEYAMIRTYLDWLIELPWSVATEDSIDIGAARRILDEDHFGLEKVKKRILEFLAVRKLKPDGKSAILCLVGPPGVGKTSVGQSIARATSRKFVRISLGGVHDEAEIRGHRRTYIGALPGNIIQGIRKTGSRNPVFMLDEMDKLSASFHGDPASALLEVLDPEQNNTFRDSYLAVPFDLSQVMFIGTANVLDGIPGPLRDRCEVIEMTGYTEEEKIQIARRYLVKRRLAENGLSEELCVITDEALRDIVRHYTREAGCRNLEREIGAIYRHVATRLAEAIDAGAPPTARRLAAEAHEDPAVEALGQKPSEGERGKASEAALAGSAQHETVPAETRGSAADRGGDGGPADRDNGEAAGGVARGDDEGSEEGSDGKNRVGGNGNAAQGPGSDEVDGAAVRGKPGIPRIDLTRLPPGFDLPIRIDVKDLHGILGARKFESEVAMRTSLPGVATGLAWTPTGGDILFVEATRMPGKGNLILTGQLGDVMKESAQAAISLIKSRGSQFGVPSETFEKTDIHIHVPAGAIPKDGPSAGVTMYTALYSLLTGQTVRSDVAMTGEISLRGLVLPVGGIKDKVLAARGAEISTVCLPSRNKKDFEDIPASARETLRFVWLEKVEDAVRAAIGDAPIGDAPGGNAPPSPPRSMGS